MYDFSHTLEQTGGTMMPVCLCLFSKTARQGCVRFSKYGLRYLFEKADFEILELQALSGFWVTFGQLLVYNLYRANRGPLRWLRIVDALGLVIQGTAWLLDRFDRSEQWTWMYLVAARRR